MILKIIHIACLILAMIPSFYLSMQIDYRKVARIKSNKDYYFITIMVALVFTFIIGELANTIITIFM